MPIRAEGSGRQSRCQCSGAVDRPYSQLLSNAAHGAFLLLGLPPGPGGANVFFHSECDGSITSSADLATCDGLPSLNLWSPPPSSTDLSTSEVGREEVYQERP